MHIGFFTDYRISRSLAHSEPKREWHSILSPVRQDAAAQSAAQVALNVEPPLNNRLNAGVCTARAAHNIHHREQKAPANFAFVEQFRQAHLTSAFGRAINVRYLTDSSHASTSSLPTAKAESR